MKYEIQGFITHSDFETSGANVSTVGEISDYSRTFSFRETSLVHGSTTFIAFYTKQIPTSGNPVEIDYANVQNRNDVTALATKISEHCYDLLASAGISTQQHFDAIKAQTATAGNPNLFTGATITTHNDVTLNGKVVPSYLEFEKGDVRFKIWLSDDKFRNEYTESTTIVIPPIADLNQFNADYATLKPVYDAVTIADRLSKVEVAMNKRPVTKIVPQNLVWVDATDPTLRIDTTWTVLCYGPNAGETTRVLDAIKSLLTSSTSHPLTIWNKRFPALLNIDKFYFIPNWEKQPIQITGQLPPFYSPTTSKDDNIKVNKMFNGSPDLTEFKKNIQASSVANKSLGFLVVGHPDNKVVGTKKYSKFFNAYPDYISVSINNPGMGLISQRTNTFIKELEKTMAAAEDENLTPTTVPNGMALVTISNVVCVQNTLSDVIIYVVHRPSHMSVLI